MKAPRKTVKRPIFRYTENHLKDEKVEIKQDNEIKTKTEEKDITKEILSQPSIVFETNEPSVFTIEPATDKLDDFDLKLGESFHDIDDFDMNAFDLMDPLDFDVIF